ncbi:MAG: VWA domain-containing protein [Chloroflexi bacterium]|nr:VWA domain-containing protein [Chloroflexota bacterium]
MPTITHLREQWQAHWPAALAIWSKFTKLRDPLWCFSPDDAKREGLATSFAMIRLDDQSVVIGLHLIADEKLEPFALEILAHEIGHHVYAPADLTDHGRMIARMRRGLPTKEHLAPFIANLYTDLLINDRLQRGANLKIADVYKTIGSDSTDRMWTFYMRIYEILWSLTKGTLAKGAIDEQLEGDAHLGARLVRAYARDWLDGSGRFAALCLPYLLENEGEQIQQLLKGWRDTEHAGRNGSPAGLTEIDDDEIGGAMHPSLDPELSGLDEEPGDPSRRPTESGASRPGGQHREPFEYGQLLRAMGIDLSDHEITARYYKERSTPYLIRFPARETPESTEPLPEGLEPWDIGSPLEAADWTESVMISPRIIPGMTTVQRVYGTTEGTLPKREPLDLDLYIDCSGSMPNPQVNVSYLALAGTIVTLSALRAGARVQATLWSGAGQFDTTGGFITDEKRLLAIITGYIAGATAFPIHILRDTFAERKPSDRPAHILIISDDGVTTMFDKDEKGNSGWDVSRTALEKARGGGTMALNLWNDIEKIPELVRAQSEGWNVRRVRTWDELIEFARWFSKLKYGEKDSSTD